MKPDEVQLDLRFTTSGVFNAVAMWFELQLDEETSLRCAGRSIAPKQHCTFSTVGILCLVHGFCCSTNPYEDKGLTWQQAVQWLEEVEVQQGQHLQLTARHDTYSISYSLPDTLSETGQAAEVQQAALQLASASICTDGQLMDTAMAGVRAKDDGPSASHPCRTGVPLMDPAWKAAYDRLGQFNGELAKACVQNPLEYRATAEAAVQFASRPHDLGVDVQQAVEFCGKMFG